MRATEGIVSNLAIVFNSIGPTLDFTVHCLPKPTAKTLALPIIFTTPCYFVDFLQKSAM